jgi:hypothetical protein
METSSSSSSKPSTAAGTDDTPSKLSPENDIPQRCIYSMMDMNHFMNSPTKNDLVTFISTLGRSTMQCEYVYDESNPLLGLSPGMASLHGSLSAMESRWLKDLPPDKKTRARFGNPVFKQWHSRLLTRSHRIIESMMACHLKFAVDRSSNKNDDDDDDQAKPWDMEVLQECSNAGQHAADSDDDCSNSNNSNSKSQKQEKVIIELQANLHQAYGHDIRLDFGTGHELCFYIFIYILCKIGMFGNPKTITPSNDIMAPVALSITSRYLKICRGLQTEYMLEPAGSHGVWGLDDYHCVPFYIGACQLQNAYYANAGFDYYEKPSCIHKHGILTSADAESILYFTCIRYIKQLKKNVPFFESSPMLNDVSQLANWAKVSGGLLRLFEGKLS